MTSSPLATLQMFTLDQVQGRPFLTYLLFEIINTLTLPFVWIIILLNCQFPSLYPVEQVEKSRSSLPGVICKKCVLNNCAKFTEKHLSVFLQSATWLKKILWLRYFLVNFAKFLEQLFYKTPQMAASEKGNNHMSQKRDLERKWCLFNIYILKWKRFWNFFK